MPSTKVLPIYEKAIEEADAPSIAAVDKASRFEPVLPREVIERGRQQRVESRFPKKAKELADLKAT